MLSGDIQVQTLPSLHTQDTVYKALQLMSDSQVAHLPVTDGGKYLGMVSEDDLAPEDENEELGLLQHIFSPLSVRSDEHLLKAVQLAAENRLSVVPVTDRENNLIGALPYGELLKYASGFMNLNEPGALIVLEMESNQYSFNEISKLVETNDAQITQLNTSNDPATGMMQVTIRINKPEVSDIIATFQRYEYTIKFYAGEELYANELRSNYDNLMNYLKI
ncbi:MAG TPA: CBS domain-containing protein [Chitinophagaceae bacterium]|nr:CBS domain-containing protein [Chitinophagaceae bacterium]